MAATTVEGGIAEALFTRLRALVLSPVLPVAFPDMAFTKPASGAWLEAALFETPTEAVTINHTGHNEYSGLLQVTVICPVMAGPINAKDIAGKVAAWFARGTILDNSGVRVRIDRPPYLSPMYRDENWTRTPVTVRYHAYAKPF